MARYADHARALELRKQGKSYSEIKAMLNVGKGTLSAWLSEYPLTPDQLKTVRDLNPRRIEKYRLTRQRTRQRRLDEVYRKVSADLMCTTRDVLLMAGFYLYWAEGGKTAPYSIMMANTDPALLVCFLQWVELLGWQRDRVSVRLQLYADMDVKKEKEFWQSELQLPMSCFGSVYVKKSNRATITYKGGFSHGTCNIYVHNRDISEYVHMGILYLRNMYGQKS